jgi:hypothetical protein
MWHVLARHAASAAAIAAGLVFPAGALAGGGISVGNPAAPAVAAVPAIAALPAAGDNVAVGTATPKAPVTVSVGVSPRPRHHKAVARVRVEASTTCLSCTDIPFDFVTQNTCTGDVVDVSGMIHLLDTMTVNGDGTMTLKAYENFQNMKGVSVDPIDGPNYQANDTQQQYERTDPFPSDITERFAEHYELVSLSPTPNMIFDFVYHVHIDSTGAMTVGVDQIDAKCSGT